jgi:hypothetical protein
LLFTYFRCHPAGVSRKNLEHDAVVDALFKPSLVLTAGKPLDDEGEGEMSYHTNAAFGHRTV